MQIRAEIVKAWSTYFGKLSRNKVILLGNQKSGTTAIAALLAKATGLDAALDIPVLWEPNYSRLLKHEITLAGLATKNRYLFSRQLIKEPNLTFFEAQTRALYPQSAFVFIVRHPLQNIRSLLNRIDLPGDETSLMDIAKPLNPQQLGLFRKDVHPFYSGNYVEMLALRWKHCANVYLENPRRFILVKYEDFLSDKAGRIAVLTEELSLPAPSDISNWLDVPFQPTGNSHVNLKAFFGRNYEPILDICAPELRQLNYDRVFEANKR